MVIKSEEGPQLDKLKQKLNKIESELEEKDKILLEQEH